MVGEKSFFTLHIMREPAADGAEGPLLLGLFIKATGGAEQQKLRHKLCPY